MTPPHLPLPPEEQEAARKRLQDLVVEHDNFDQTIAQLIQNPPPADQLLIPRLKKRKQQLLNHIRQLETLLTPDEPA
ncbi:MAG: DUF465 domain-containing protein [Zoogloeaceae bacterium]|jgi:hypothetical protein|nr:DUF465 domain-containing protein [Zoogloeaceae bacterium]